MIHQAINALVDHFEAAGLLSPADREYARNRAYDLFHTAPKAYAPSDLSREEAFGELMGLAKKNNLLGGDGTAFGDDFLARLSDIFLPRPGEYQRLIESLHQTSPQAATEMMYRMAIDSEYVKARRIARNIHHVYQADFGPVEITINLSKPEKTPDEIRLAQAETSDYPACLLCRENVGLGGLPRPPRAHHRIYHIRLAGEDYYFQYSPYAYFNEHAIVFSHDHRPMVINETVVEHFLDFVELFPHYFISANADLPIVGGSILTHDHYQAGRADFPIDQTSGHELISRPGLSVSRLDWPISAIRLQGDRQPVAQAARQLIAAWQNYSQPELGIIARSLQAHNTLNIMARKTADGYVMTLLLRNNRTDRDHPDGIFHTRPIWQVVKRENIGIIEVLGLAILPGRLAEEMQRFDQLPEYQDWLAAVPGGEPLDQLGYTFGEILKDCAVFGRDEAGRAALEDFIRRSLD